MIWLSELNGNHDPPMHGFIEIIRAIGRHDDEAIMPEMYVCACAVNCCKYEILVVKLTDHTRNSECIFKGGGHTGTYITLHSLSCQLRTDCADPSIIVYCSHG